MHDKRAGQSLTHFFLDIGGFLLESPGSEMFPIDAEQLFWLVKNGYVAYPDLDAEDIEDRANPTAWQAELFYLLNL